MQQQRQCDTQHQSMRAEVKANGLHCGLWLSYQSVRVEADTNKTIRVFARRVQQENLYHAVYLGRNSFANSFFVDSWYVNIVITAAVMQVGLGVG